MDYGTTYQLLDSSRDRYSTRVARLQPLRLQRKAVAYSPRVKYSIRLTFLPRRAVLSYCSNPTGTAPPDADKGYGRLSHVTYSWCGV